MPEPHLRAADADRAAVAAVLGEHMAAGRLTLAEYDERVTQAYAAKTYGELDALTADLPSPHRRSTTPHPASAQTSPTQPSSAQPPAPASRPTAPAHLGASPAHFRGSLHDGWRAWLSTGVIVVTIWLLTSLGSGELQYFWPMWVIGPWGVALIAATIAGGRRQGPPRLGPGKRG